MTDQKPETLSSKSSTDDAVRVAPDNRTVGPVTLGATAGGTTGAALAQILVWFLAQNHIDASTIDAALTVVFAAVLGIVGGYLVPPSTKRGKHA